MTMLGMYVTIQFVSKIFKVFHLRVPLIIVNKESKKIFISVWVPIISIKCCPKIVYIKGNETHNFRLTNSNSLNFSK